METTLFLISKNAIFLQFFENSLNDIDVSLVQVLSIDENIIK